MRERERERETDRERQTERDREGESMIKRIPVRVPSELQQMPYVSVTSAHMS